MVQARKSGGCEVEITPEMLAAGAMALCACCDEFSSKTDSTLEWFAGQVFEAMYAAAQR
jgi:hypothetical protein